VETANTTVLLDRSKTKTARFCRAVFSSHRSD
jgi:hypothetical protein